MQPNQAKPCLIAVMSLFLVLDTAVIAARVYVRAIMIRAFGWDDAALCLAYVGFATACIMGFTALHFGYASDEGPAPAGYHYDQHKAQTFLYANQLALYLASGLAKLGVALVLWRLAVTRRFRLVLAVSVAVVLAWTFTTTLFAAWLCTTDTGSASYVSSATCTAVGLFRTVSNIFIDYFYALVPIPIVRGARMDARTKVVVCVLLGLGLFASAATIAKLVIIVQLSTADRGAQQPLHHQLLIWADVELGLAVFCASAAALRPLLNRSPLVWGTPTAATGDSSHTYVASPRVPPAVSLVSLEDRR
ncbi:hypothetical protein KVR01_010482 [Diaporthe batatas]|uniref:uncharacterized protein n=1 Tax=Diaporthe batatas TaxID=748121 RepID=UPI001D03ED50|nr:uncharacterized protein KVR01_010482 [Diaporthe batatas]KAG8159845.1 hypothetical protein KVR01_010482 [Diaporthe batatas]